MVARVAVAGERPVLAGAQVDAESGEREGSTMTLQEARDRIVAAVPQAWGVDLMAEANYRRPIWGVKGAERLSGIRAYVYLDDRRHVLVKANTLDEAVELAIRQAREGAQDKPVISIDEPAQKETAA